MSRARAREKVRGYGGRQSPSVAGESGLFALSAVAKKVVFPGPGTTPAFIHWQPGNWDDQETDHVRIRTPTRDDIRKSKRICQGIAEAIFEI